MLQRLFGLTAHGTSVRTEILAGFTTFITMAYIVVVNPLILGDAGMLMGLQRRGEGARHRKCQDESPRLRRCLPHPSGRGKGPAAPGRRRAQSPEAGVGELD